MCNSVVLSFKTVHRPALCLNSTLIAMFISCVRARALKGYRLPSLGCYFNDSVVLCRVQFNCVIFHSVTGTNNLLYFKELK